VWGTTTLLHLLRVDGMLQVVEAIAAAVAKGLSIPIVYNTSSYDGLASLALMDGLVDVTCRTSRQVLPGAVSAQQVPTNCVSESTHLSHLLDVTIALISSSCVSNVLQPSSCSKVLCADPEEGATKHRQVPSVSRFRTV